MIKKYTIPSSHQMSLQLGYKIGKSKLAGYKERERLEMTEGRIHIGLMTPVAQGMPKENY